MTEQRGVEAMKRFLNRLWQDDSGQDATEYVLLVVLIALAITAGMTVLATGINGAFSNAATTLNTTSGGS
jgi:Flp pilus assembly pilin Flp